MGVDIETYRGRIGTFKFATGNDVATLECFVNFSGGLKAVFMVTCIGVILLLTTTEPFSIQNEHADELLVSSSQSSGSVWFIKLLLLIAGVESNPGPKQFDSQNADNNGIPAAPIAVAPVSPQTASTDVHSLGSLAEQSRGSTCEEYEGARALLNVAQGVSQSTALVCDSRTGSQEQSRDSKNADNEELSCATTDVLPVSNKSTPIDSNSLGGIIKKRLRTVATRVSSGFKNKDDEEARSRFNVAPVVSQSSTVACDSPIVSKNAEYDELSCATTDVLPVSTQSTQMDLNSLGRIIKKSLRTVATRVSSGFRNKDDEEARSRLDVAPVVSQSSTVACDIPRGSQTQDNEGTRTRLDVAPVVSQSTTVAINSPRGSQNNDIEAARSRLDVAPVLSQSTTAACDSSTDSLEEEKETFKSLLRLLELEPFIQSEITVNNVLMTDSAEQINEKNNSFKDLPWLFLKQLLAGNSDAFDLRIYNLESNTITDTSNVSEGSVSAMYATSSKSDGVSPLDLFIVVFQCCSPELRQLLFQKLYLCKKAIPFIYKSGFTQQPVMSLWALYSIVIANKVKTPSGNYTTIESEVIDMPTKFVSFARFGRPPFSKSKLLNGILCGYDMDIFFHKDCQSGMVSRHLTGGYIEMFWLPTIGQTENRFNDPMTFLNVRGDFGTAFEDHSLIANISDVFTIFIDITSFLESTEKITHILSKFRFVLLIIPSPLDSKDIKTRYSLMNFESSFKNRKTKLKILCTFDKNKEKNLVDISSEVAEQILNHLKEQGLHGRPLRQYLTNDISTDESACSKYAEDHAKDIVSLMRDASSQEEDMAINITPVQFKCSTDLGKMLRHLFLNKDADLNNTYKEKIRSLRYEQLFKITNSVKHFMNCLEKCAQMPNALHFLLGWLRFYLGRNKRDVLSRLMQENQQLWEEYRNMKKDGKPSSSELEDKEMSIKQSESRIENASFGIEQLFREVGHIYDAVILLNLNPAQFDIPKVETVANIFATLVLDGQPFELLDGNSFYMPGEWIKRVLGIVNTRICNKKVLALSVLGLQSSGKSTLLNTMFGVQFSTSVGRCTRGIHSQLLPMRNKREQKNKPLFEYVLVIDTEGLRAPELSDKNYNRDNELATIITGLGDITILNIMGENAIEIRDILQITVHAFLRLKLANRRLDMRKSCILLHQNVSDIAAAEKMKTSLELTVRNLDSVARESAESEGISGITTFDQIIEFNTDRNVWYLPSFWKGNPPMAQINPRYSEEVVSIIHELLDRALKDQSKSFKRLDDIVIHTNELWKGVLAEDFVFSFKNSIEKKAYVAMDKTRKEKLQNLESRIDTAVFKLSQNVFSECKTQNELGKAKETVILQMKRLISQLEQETISELERFFMKNDYTDITVQWKERTMNMLREMCIDITHKKMAETDHVQDKRAFDIMTTSSYGAQEEEFRKKSIELANLIKGKGMNDKENEKRFKEIWNSFVHYSLKEENLQIPVSSLKPKFIDCLLNCFSSNHPILYQILDQYEMFKNPSQTKVLSGSLHLTTLSENDISIKSRVKRIFSKVPVFNVGNNSFKIVTNRLEIFFKDVDHKLQQFCSRDYEITDNDVRSFVIEIERSLAECVQNNSDNFTLIISFNIKALVHVCYIACHRFEEHNSEYQRLHGLKVRLAKYKSQCRERFFFHIHERNAESTAAALFRHAVSNFVFETINDGMSNRVKNELKCKHLPKTKYDLIITMLTEMVNIRDFKTFVYYIQSSKAYATAWITTRANNYLFARDSRQYFEIASTDTKVCLDDIKRGILITTEHFRNSSISIKRWLQYFVNQLKVFRIPIETLREVQRELDSKNIDAGNFKSMLLEELEPIEKRLLKIFEIETETSVRWRGSNPYENVITDIWGCPEQCVFCGEPCAESSSHPNSNHKCMQHRPPGINGGHEENSKKILLTTCNYDVTQSGSGKCRYFGFLCNPGKKEACPSGSHKLSEYNKIIPRWEIKGSLDPEERSTFWLRFVGKYKEELGDFYGIDVSDVPSPWSELSKSEAIESLRKIYPE